MSIKPEPSDRTTALAVTASAPIKVGYLVPGSKPGALVVDFEGNAAGPLAARSVVAKVTPPKVDLKGWAREQMKQLEPAKAPLTGVPKVETVALGR